MYEEDRENREDRDQEIERTEIMDDVDEQETQTSSSRSQENRKSGSSQNVNWTTQTVLLKELPLREKLSGRRANSRITDRNMVTEMNTVKPFRHQERKTAGQERQQVLLQQLCCLAQ